VCVGVCVCVSVCVCDVRSFVQGDDGKAGPDQTGALGVYP